MNVIGLKEKIMFLKIDIKNIKVIYSYLKTNIMGDSGDFTGDSTLEIKDIKPIVPSELYKIIKDETQNLLGKIAEEYNLDVNELSGIAIMTDTDNSKLKAISYYQNIYFSSQ